MKNQLKLVIKTTFTTLVLTSVLGCSSKELYESVQPKYDQNECSKLPSLQYDECIRNEAKSYKDYQKEREEILNKKT